MSSTNQAAAAAAAVVAAAAAAAAAASGTPTAGSSRLAQNSASKNNDNQYLSSFQANRPGPQQPQQLLQQQHIGRKPAFGQTCSMKTLIQDGIIQAGDQVLTLEIDGHKFCGDLFRDGTISMSRPDGVPQLFHTPVAWANHCCRVLNPESKPLNAWSSIRFKGKRLDSYKLKWYRAQKKPISTVPQSGAMNDNINGGSSLIKNLQQINLPSHNNHLQASQFSQQHSGSSRLMLHNPITNCFPQYENPLKNKKLIKSILISNNMDNDCRKLVSKSLDLSDDPSKLSIAVSCNNDNNNNSTGNIENIIRPNVISYEHLGTRGPHNTHDPNTMIKCIPFSAIDRIQPFNVNITTNALLLIDFHSHLVPQEVAGYLAGNWDLGTHVLTITQAFPCRTSLDNDETAVATEEEIRQEIERKQMTVVGWYHSHQGKYSNHPTIKDIQSQMEHQITMKESTGGYTPCVGLICSPHDSRSADDLSPSFQIYWVMPPPEHLMSHYGRPMQMYYSVNRDLFLTQDLLLEMRLLATYYIETPNMIDFTSQYRYNDQITNLDKLSSSIKTKLPKDLQESEYPDEPSIWKAAVDHFWKFLKNLVVSPPEPVQESKVEEQQACEADGDAEADSYIDQAPELDPSLEVEPKDE